MKKSTSLADAIINTYGAEQLRNALSGRQFGEQKIIIRLLLKRDFPHTIPTWGGLTNSVHALKKKLQLNQ